MIIMTDVLNYQMKKCLTYKLLAEYNPASPVKINVFVYVRLL